MLKMLLASCTVSKILNLTFSFNVIGLFVGDKAKS